MTSDPHAPNADAAGQHESVEMPTPTVAPLVLALGVALLASGLLLGTVFLIVGGVILVVGLGMWVSQMLPGKGHWHEPFVEPERRAGAVKARLGGVQRLREGMPGSRLRMPEKLHPISAGVKGGIIGGVVIVIPALIYGLVSRHGIWYPANLLVGMVLPGIGELSVDELQKFNLSYLILAAVLHIVFSVVLGLMYGVLMPTLPEIPGPIAWGGLLIPLLWTALTFGLMERIDPVLARRVNWPWFIFSQFVFGIVASAVVHRNHRHRPLTAGVLGGIVGGVVMPLPAMFWALTNGHSLWYSSNLLAGMVLPEVGKASDAQLEAFHADWLIASLLLHAGMSLGIGVANGLLLPRLPQIPGPISWGGLLLPLLWTGGAFSLMGVINPLLQNRVDWPWWVASQFVFGVTAAIVVVRSEMVYITPAGQGPDRVPLTESSGNRVVGPGEANR